MEESFESDYEDSESEILPVESFKDELMLHIQQYQIVICVGETGSGKTTKIPQFFLDSNLLQNKMMAVTQPRRVAAITVSHRVADERNSVLGDEVGYAVRFDDKTSSRTKIKFMTDGILVRECLGNPTLAQYNAIMLDEAHERSIHTDILFGLVKQACIHRPDLKVLITSATLDITKFSKYFNDCPIVRVPGRLFPVDIYHSKIRQVMTATGPSSNAYVASAVRTVLKIHQSQEDGHILLFLTGQEEIEKACEMIRAAVSSPEHEEDGQWNEVTHKRVTRKALKLAVIPLYASLPQQSQKLVFKSVSPNVRKCVVSTNIAETSVTVPGIRYVIDPGYIKQKCYDPSRRMESLIVVPISQVSAQQRAGRAGRTGPGQCYRLYSTDCYNSFCPETIPEIKRCNIANTLLYLKVLGITDVIGFDFMDPPSETQMIEGLVMLHMLGALDGNGDITEVGRGMSTFPLEPNLSRMLYEASREENNCLEEIATICAMLSVENVYFYPKRYKTDQQRAKDQSFGNGSASRSGGQRNSNDVLPVSLENELERNEAVDAHMRLWKSDGDHFTLLNIYNKWTDAGCTLSWCETSFIRFSAMKLAKSIRSQLLGEANDLKSSTRTRPNTDGRDAEENSSVSKKRMREDGSRDRMKRSRKDVETAIKRCLVAGLYMNAARLCANETAYRSMPFQISKDRGLSNDWQLTEMLEEVKLLHLHPSSGYGGEFRDRPPEYVVYQDLVHTGRLLMRYVVKVDYEMVEWCRQRWIFIHPYRLSNRTLPRPERQQQQAVVATGEASLKTEAPKGEGGGQSSVEAARLRFLARKQGKPA